MNFKEIRYYMRTKPVAKPTPFGYTERLRSSGLPLWAVYSNDSVQHVSLTYRGAEKWRINSILMGIREGL